MRARLAQSIAQYLNLIIVLVPQTLSQRVKVSAIMIIIPSSQTVKKQPVIKHTWQFLFKGDLFNFNQQSIQHHSQFDKTPHHSPEQKQAENTLKKLVSSRQEVEVEDKNLSNSSHSVYSSFIPLPMQTQLDDQLTQTFPQLRFLKNETRSKERNSFLEQISSHMKRCRNNQSHESIEKGWHKILQTYLCQIDSITAIALYLHLKKKGVSTLSKYHKHLAPKCKFTIFVHRITQMGSFFEKVNGTAKTKILSVDAHEDINEVTLPKTMKNLFCGICLTYDCGRHAHDTSIEANNFQYIAPSSQISQKDHVQNAVVMCRVHEQLRNQGTVTSLNLIGSPCSPKCFTLLTQQQWRRIQNARAKMLSPLVKGIIKLGIQMYSFSPCDIWNLLAGCQQKHATVISCSHVFLFFIEEYSLLNRISFKLYSNEANQLKREKKIEMEDIIEPKRKKRSTKNRQNQSYSSNMISTCCHYFIGQEPTDGNCQQCQCRERGFCITQCLCRPDCPIRRQGCRCKRDECQTSRCDCFKNNMECDPLLCRNCLGDEKKNNCKNCQIMLRDFKKVRVGQSTVQMAGLGLFAAESISKGQLVTVYSGQLIEHYIEVFRESLSVDNSFYNFCSLEGTIDARFMGNLSRFINHGDHGLQNLEAVNKLTQGRQKVGLYALRGIKKEQELFFDYDGEGKLYQNYREKYPFIRSKHGGKAKGKE